MPASGEEPAPSQAALPSWSNCAITLRSPDQPARASVPRFDRPCSSKKLAGDAPPSAGSRVDRPERSYTHRAPIALDLAVLLADPVAQVVPPMVLSSAAYKKPGHHPHTQSTSPNTLTIDRTHPSLAENGETVLKLRKLRVG